MNENFELVEYMYQDSEMATETLTETLKDLNGKENKIKPVIEDILKGYERYLEECTKILKSNGIELKSNGFMAKMGATIGIKKEIREDNSDASIADMLIKGISMGSLDMEKKINNYKENAQKEYLKLAKDFFTFQKDNMEALKKFL